MYQLKCRDKSFQSRQIIPTVKDEKHARSIISMLANEKLDVDSKETNLKQKLSLVKQSDTLTMK